MRTELGPVRAQSRGSINTYYQEFEAMSHTV